MRIASTQYQATMTTALQNANAQVERVTEQMASGERLLRPSDDPISSVRLARLAREEAALDQYQSNIGALRSRLSKNEVLLDGMVDDLMSARDLLVWAVDGSNTSDDLNSMATSLETLRDSILFTANTTDAEGSYLFSGTATQTAPIAYDASQPAGSRYSYAGNDGQQLVVVGNGVTQAANVSLSEVADLLNQLDAAAETVATPDVDIGDTAVATLLRGSLDGLDVALDAINGKIAILGGAQNTLNTLEGNNENVSVSNQQAALSLGELDYGEAAIRLSAYTTALEATQAAYGKVSGLTLFDVI